MIISAMSSPSSMPSSSSVASRPGLLSRPACPRALSPATAGPRQTYAEGKAVLHLVSTSAARQRLVLGQLAVAHKPKDIIAIPKLLDLLQIEGAIVIIDATGCQRAIARKIVDKKVDYILRHMAQNLIRARKGTLSVKANLNAAAWDDSHLIQLFVA
jgi:hypothetical protein